MRNCLFSLLVLLFANSLFVSCSNPIEEDVRKPTLLIKTRDDSGKIISGAIVRLYKDSTDPGITKLSDSTGLVIFSELDIALYYWLAQKGCKTNRISQMSLNRKLVPGAAHYGYSVLTETGALKIINSSPDAYKVSDSLFNIIAKKDSPYLEHRRVHSYLLHIEKASTPGIGKDTLVKIRCGDTSIINLPY
jgi:hypothetical protein